MRGWKALEIVAHGHPAVLVFRPIPSMLGVLHPRPHAARGQFRYVRGQPGQNSGKDHRRENARPSFGAETKTDAQGDDARGEEKREITITRKETRRFDPRLARTGPNGLEHRLIPQGKTKCRKEDGNHGKPRRPVNRRTFAHGRHHPTAQPQLTAKRPRRSAAAFRRATPRRPGEARRIHRRKQNPH